jgi:hypothetical protein
MTAMSGLDRHNNPGLYLHFFMTLAPSPATYYQFLKGRKANYVFTNAYDGKLETKKAN